MIITNPLGLLALIGLPILVLIYFLQRRAQVVPVSTLFLLEKTQRENSAGRRFDVFTNSLAFWLSILTLLALTWLLILPRYVSAQSTRRIAVVLDSSASMQTVQDTLAENLALALPGLQGNASHAEFTLLTHDPQQPRLYQGGSLDDLVASLTSFSPTGSALDPSDALRIARAIVGTEGQVVYVTDHTGSELPLSTQRLAIGSPVSNVGFTGVSFEEKEGRSVWTALVRNFSDTAQTRTWKLSTLAGQSTPEKSVTLQPGAIATLSGAFPPDETKALLRLSADEFTLDDVIPLLVPAPKTVETFLATSSKFSRFTHRIVTGFDALAQTASSAEADLQITSYDPLLPVLPEGNAIVLVDESSTGLKYLSGGIFTEPHPLVDGLNWAPLAVRDSIQIEVLSTDRVLLWQEKRPLILLREKTTEDSQSSTSQLIFNFDITRSNALKLPATAVILHRFIDGLRKNKVSFEQLNLETNQSLPITAASNLASFQSALTAQESTFSSLRNAPSTPGFLRISQGDVNLLEAAVTFADTRESNFTQAASENELSLSGTAQNLHTRGDPYWRIILLLSLALLIVIWRHVQKKDSAVAVTA